MLINSTKAPGLLSISFKSKKFKGSCWILMAFSCLMFSAKTQGQLVSTGYVWSQSFQTYKAASSTTSTTPSNIVPTFWDDDTYTGYTFPFNFTYNGTLYSAGVGTIGIDSDGWIAFSTGAITMTGTTFGGSWVSASDHTGVYLNGSGNNNGFCGFNSDIEEQVFANFTCNRTNGSPTLTAVSDFTNVRVGVRLSGTGITDGTVVNAFNAAAQTITMSSNATANGTAVAVTPRTSVYAFLRGVFPYRQFVIQWTRASRFSAVTGDDFSFQLVLNEGGGVATYQTLQAVYGKLTTTNTGSQNAQVGLRGASATDYNARTTSTNWSATTLAGTNAATCNLTSSVFPVSGLTFTWSPPCSVAASAAGAISGTNPVCPGSSVDYSIPGVPGAIFYTWTYTGAGTTLSGTTTLPLNTLNFGLSATSGTLTVTPGNLCGNGASSSLAITVASVSSATISYPLATYCQSVAGTISPTLTGPGGGTYSASPSGLSITTAGVVTPSTSTAGTYTVTYTYTSGTCIVSSTTTITISPNPVVSVTATPSIVCTGGSSQLSASADAGGNYTVASIPYTVLTPATSSTEIWGATYADESVSGAIPIPFSFNYYGQNITQLFACSNGYITLQTSYPASLTAQALPNPATPNNVVALAWNDLEVDNFFFPGAYVRYFVNGTAPNQVMVIEFNKLNFYFAGAGEVTGQIRLYQSDNHIEVAVTTVNDAASGELKTLGIENSLGTVGITPAGRNNAAWNVTNEAWSFSPKPVSYLWTPATFLSSTSISNPVASGVTSTTAYNVKVTDIATGCFSNGTATVTIGTGLSGIYTVGAAGNYPTLTAAVNAYNTLCISGPVVFSLIDPTYSASETFPIHIKSNAYQSAVNTLTIRPATGVTATISGAAANDALIRISGKYISINGSNNNTTTRNLSITNTSTTTPTAVLLGSLSSTAAVTNVAIKNCTITNGINTSSAVVVSAASAGTAGYFSNDTIQNNLIQKAYIGIYCIGVNAAGNGNGLQVLSNDLTASGANAMNIAGIYVQDIDGATIQYNNVGNLRGTDAYDDKGIWLATGVKNSSVLNNKISNLNYTGTGGYGAYGICITTGVANANIKVINNMIANISGDGFNYTSASFGLDNPVGIMLFTAQTGIQLYFNSINLGTAGFTNTLNQSNAISAGIRLNTGSRADIRNNIIVNNLGRTGASTATGYGAIGILASNNSTQLTNLNFNDYAINPGGSIAKYIGQINATAQTTLAGWQAATVQEANGITVVPVFTSATDLHLSPAGSNLAMNNTGTPIAGITVDYDTTTRNGLTPDMGADEFLAPNTGSWVGKTSTDWLVNTNWETNKIPDRSIDVSITGGYTFMPTIITTQAVRGLALSAPVVANTPILTLTSPGILQVYGTMTRTGGSIDGLNGTLEMDSSIASQPIPASLFVNNNLKDLIINNSNNPGVVINGPLDIYRSVTYGASGSNLTTNSNLTFKSTATETAWLGNTTGKILTGTVTIERYIPTGINHNKTWQLLAAPIKSAVSVKASWMEGNTPLANIKPGYGTTISSEVLNAVARGYDFYTPIVGSLGGPSLKTYNPATNTWIGFDDGVTLTNAKTLTPQKKGYFVFVRGDRSVITSGGAAVPTVLRITGTPYYGVGATAPPTTNVPSNSFETIGNPYPSAIDFTLITKAAGVDNVFYLWDPKLPGTNSLGGYQTISGITGWLPTPGSTNYPAATPVTRIQSGQAFFVHGTGGGLVSFSEAAKVTGSSLVVRQSSNNLRLLRLDLYKVSSASLGPVDGNVVALDKDYSNAFDNKDALKIANSTENIGIASNNKILAVEARRPFVKNDTVFYNMANLRPEAYQFRFGPENIHAPNLSAYLVDRYLNTMTPVSLTDSTFIDFNIINEEGSYAANRFYLIFKKRQHDTAPAPRISATHNSEISSSDGAIAVYPNPLVNKMLTLSFTNQQVGIYRLELSNTLGQIVMEKTVQVSSKFQKASIQLGKDITAGNYQISIIGGNGMKTVQQVVVN